jgi:hypothetical protein
MGHEFDHSGNIIISHENNNRFQNLYASQVYGTFFGIYAKFKIADNHSSSEVVFLDEVKLQLKNFKGLLDVGFPKNMKPQYLIQDIKNDKHEIIGKRIKIFIKCAYLKDTTPIITIRGSDLGEIKNGYRIVVERITLSLHGHTFEEVAKLVKNADEPQNEIKPYAGGIFDSEFYYRNGDLLRKRSDGDSVLSHRDAYETPKSSAADSADSDPMVILDGTPSCKRSNNYIFINYP